jgi:hypothetical protein
VVWTGGQRFVHDGLITTTAGVTSGIPGALELVKELAGPAEAERVGAAIGYPDQSSAGKTTIPAQTFDISDAPVALNAVLPWFRPTVGVGLTDGISELDAVAVFEVYTVSGAARTVALAASTAVTTQHGLVLITTPYTSQTQHLDRLILPGSAARDAGLLAWARGRQLDPTALTEQSATRGAFDAALEDLVGQAGNATAMTTAKFIDYPTTRLDLQGTTTDSRSIWLLVLTAVLAAGVGALPSLLRRGQGLAGRQALASEPAPIARRTIMIPTAATPNKVPRRRTAYGAGLLFASAAANPATRHPDPTGPAAGLPRLTR